jgi:hypothetical protein
LINSTTLRKALKDIYGIEDKYLVPLDSGWYVPTYDPNDKVGTWIGYRILSIKPNVRAGYQGTAYSKSIKCRFRLSFVGKQAEDLALQTLLFDERTDVVKAFEECQTQLNYISREILTYPIREGGLNDSLCWFVDIECQSFYEAEWKGKDWKVEPMPVPEPWVTSVSETSSRNRIVSGTLKINT